MELWNYYLFFLLTLLSKVFYTQLFVFYICINILNKISGQILQAKTQNPLYYGTEGVQVMLKGEFIVSRLKFDRAWLSLDG